LGVIIPFIGIGLLAGSISKLARSTYRHKSKIRAISGLILIAYSIYLIVQSLFYLL
jgi:cytochrome c biogenesis protein CcdA